MIIGVLHVNVVFICLLVESANLWKWDAYDIKENNVLIVSLILN